ncbi:hypothetical protein LLE49_23810 [Alicyclobacillus tolerans]|uniref:hypothetical protein n=1 Tax=Alicyclobacillus tolerans TaxID=90970 RepID=UPI001F466F45|nr:hypothetical protein [Alicyclobacillus tolerans]MCF8567751.1 hypothetical protein [Alicyclobacillus tolerans]
MEEASSVDLDGSREITDIKGNVKNGTYQVAIASLTSNSVKSGILNKNYGCELIDRLDELGEQLYHVLLRNEAPNVLKLVIEQESCMRRLQMECDSNKEFRNQAKERLRILERKCALNQKLLGQALQLTNGLVRKISQQQVNMFSHDTYA